MRVNSVCECVCMSALCVCVRAFARTGRRDDEEADGSDNQKQDPNKMMWGKTETKGQEMPKIVVGKCETYPEKPIKCQQVLTNFEFCDRGLAPNLRCWPSRGSREKTPVL